MIDWQIGQSLNEKSLVDSTTRIEHRRQKTGVQTIFESLIPKKKKTKKDAQNLRIFIV